MATEVPARLLGLNHVGRLAVGVSADVALLTERLEVVATYVRGERVYSRDG
jgi:N-acetylglucosamine-6-phosphate deacetylase